MAGPIEIDVWQGDIAELEVDAIVVAASESLFMTAGAAMSVKRQGGDEIERAAVDQGPISPGTAIVTTGGRLPAMYVIHAVAVGHDRVADARVLESAVRAALAFADPLQLKRLAIAPLGVETGAFTPEESAAALIRVLTEAVASTPVESIVLAAVHASEARHGRCGAGRRCGSFSGVTDGAARRLADAIGRRGLTAPARLLADAHRPLDPLVSDLGAALGPMIRAVVGRGSADLSDALARPGALDRLIEELDRGPAERRRADTR